MLRKKNIQESKNRNYKRNRNGNTKKNTETTGNRNKNCRKLLTIIQKIEKRKASTGRKQSEREHKKKHGLLTFIDVKGCSMVHSSGT